MRSRKSRIVSAVLALVIGLGCLSGFKGKVKALSELSNVQISSEGILSWDAFPGAVDYDWTINTGGGISEETSVDLKDFCSLCSWKSDSYQVWLFARDADGNPISETWTGTYDYVSDHAQLATPSNLQWTGNVATWDPVPYATRYRVGFKYGSWEYASTNSFDFTNYATETPVEHEIYIIAEAPGYPESEPYEGTALLYQSRPAMSNVSISANGILSWDEFDGAAEYDWSLGTGGGFIQDTSIDLNYYFLRWEKDPGTYEINLFAVDENRTRLSTIWTGSYTYTKPECKKVTITDGISDLNEAPAGMTVTITANDKENYTFDHWKVISGSVTLANDSSKQTTFVMGSQNVRVDAYYTYSGPFISMFEVACDEPVAGRHPSEATINTTDYQITSSKWIDVATNTALSATDVFVSGKEYKLQCTLQASEYPFYTDPICYINGSSEGVSYPTAMSFVVICEKTFTAKAFTVSFDTNGGSSVPSQSVSAGGYASSPAMWPYKTGYVFVDWCSDAACTTSFDFDNTAISADTTIYAKFVQINAAITVADFDDVYVGYTPSASKVAFQIKNEAVINPSQLHLEITGSNAGAFTMVYKDSGMEYGPATFSNNFTITPDEQLKIGTYTATATLYYDTDEDGIYETLIASDDFSFTVKPITGSISIDEFEDKYVGYDPLLVNKIIIKISDTSRMRANRMSLYISGTDADAFEFGFSDSGDLQGPGMWSNSNFWVRPVTGLPEGTYEATATLQYDSDGNGTPDATIGSCTLRFTVLKIPVTQYTVTYDANGGVTGADWKDSELVDEGTSITLAAPAENVVKAPEGKEFAGFEIAGVEIPAGAVITITGDTTIKYSWKDVEVTPEPGPDTPTPEPGPDTPTPEPATPAPEPAKDPSFEDFVERLYTVALGRASEPEGKAFWVEQVVKNGFTGADCARFFMLGAPEFLGRGLTDDEFVEVLYKTYFDRDSESDGKAYWMGRLASGEDRAVLVEEFIESVEWCNVCAMYGVKSGALYHKATVPSKNAVKFATRLYTCCLGRDPEEDGLNYWALALTNLDATGYQAASLFFESPEFQGFNTTNEEYIRRLYTTFMGREADADGFNYWVGLLNNGTSRTDAMKAFASCPEFQEICNQYGIVRGEI